MTKKQMICFTALLASILILPAGKTIDKFDIYGYVETLKSDELTLLFYEEPSVNEYLILDSETVIGRVQIKKTLPFVRGKFKYRAIADFTLVNSGHRKLLKAGSEIALQSAFHAKKRDYSHPYYREKIRYKDEIQPGRDQRKMVLVSAGNFIMGSDRGNDDEKPAHQMYTGFFHIDISEVSNSDYLVYVKEANVKSPDSWGGLSFKEGEGDRPVMVSYYEADAYAKWCGKRLASEAEWEKAAKILSPLKKINFSGIREWTSDWYKAYPGSLHANQRFGEQYKVVRRGGGYTTGSEPWLTRRETGGSPSLRIDNTAGFRCVKDPVFTDRE